MALNSHSQTFFCLDSPCPPTTENFHGSQPGKRLATIKYQWVHPWKPLFLAPYGSMASIMIFSKASSHSIIFPKKSFAYGSFQSLMLPRAQGPRLRWGASGTQSSPTMWTRGLIHQHSGLRCSCGRSSSCTFICSIPSVHRFLFLTGADPLSCGANQTPPTIAAHFSLDCKG